MNDKQLGVLYTIMLTIWLVVILSLSYLLDESKPVSANDYADKLCQELYGPQVGHTWVDASLMCETSRGEIVAVRAPE